MFVVKRHDFAPHKIVRDACPIGSGVEVIRRSKPDLHGVIARRVGDENAAFVRLDVRRSISPKYCQVDALSTGDPAKSMHHISEGFPQ